MIVAGLPGHLASKEIACRLELHQPDVGLQQRRVDPLALAGSLAFEQRRQDAVGEHESGGQVGYWQTNPHRPSPGLAIDSHQPRQALSDLIEPWSATVRTALAETRDAAVHESRVGLRERFVVDSESML